MRLIYVINGTRITSKKVMARVPTYQGAIAVQAAAEMIFVVTHGPPNQNVGIAAISPTTFNPSPQEAAFARVFSMKRKFAPVISPIKRPTPIPIAAIATPVSLNRNPAFRAPVL